MASPNVRAYGRLRTAQLERLSKMAPALVLYTGERYDFDLTAADPHNPPVKMSRLEMILELSRRHHAAVEINEPATVYRWFSLIGEIAAVRLRSALSRRPSTVAAYCMGNADPALEVATRWRLPPRIARVVVRAMMSVLVRATDRLAFATAGSLEMYESYVGGPALDRRARLFEAIPAACDCLNQNAERRTDQLLFVGAFIERKGIRQAMAAWEVLHAERPGATFRVIGKGRLERQIRAWAQDRDEVTVEIDPPRAVIHRALRESGALILLSQREGHWREQIGEPIQEGLSHGCEVVTTSETGLAAWLAAHGHAVLAPESPPTEVADAIQAAFERALSRRGSLDDLPAFDQRFAADRWMMTDR
jgi:glycosyltransferase involved in cell wall biosynthesis